MFRFRERFRYFMMGRNGFDRFSTFLCILAMVMMVVSIFIPFKIPKLIVSGLGTGVMIYSYFRIFSRNLSARARENYWYTSLVTLDRFRSPNAKKKAMDRKTHKIFKCPNCRQKIRVPKHRGKICIRCPKCRIEFVKKT